MKKTEFSNKNKLNQSRLRNGRRNKKHKNGKRVPSLSRLRSSAQTRLSRFRQKTVLAVAVTAALLLLWEPAGTGEAPAETAPMENPQNLAEQVADPAIAIEEATGTIREILLNLYGVLPKLLLAIVIFILAAILAKWSRHFLARYFGSWRQTNAISTLVKIGIFFLAAMIALGVMTGDARAALGSVGLLGLALSWALQTPIESFTGWLMNSFHSYYRVGDRIEVGEVFGDVYKIDVLTTTVWEAGGPGKSVSGAQPTGALITFPNWEVLRANIVNYSRDFPYVWDELTISITNESDLTLAMQLVKNRTEQLTGEEMRIQAQKYKQLLNKSRLNIDIDDEPQVYLSLAESWTNLTIRYLVHVRKRRAFSTQLLLALLEELEQHQENVQGAYPRTEVLVHGSELGF